MYFGGYGATVCESTRGGNEREKKTECQLGIHDS